MKEEHRRFTVILCRPQNQENIGRVARAMKATGFSDLRLVGSEKLGEKAFVPAVHSGNILRSASHFSGLDSATDDLDVIFAATAKRRKNFTVLDFFEAVEKMNRFPENIRIGLLFGNERTGLTSPELLKSNFRFLIPQAGRQPSYNLASAVLLTLFQIFAFGKKGKGGVSPAPVLSRKKQEETFSLILNQLEDADFIHAGNRRHVQEMIFDLFGRLALTEKDRRLLLAIFSKGSRKL